MPTMSGMTKKNQYPAACGGAVLLQSMKQLRIGYLSTLYHTSHILRHQATLEAGPALPAWRLFGTGPAMIEAFARGNSTWGISGFRLQ